MAILGLTTSETTVNFWSQNYRRRVFHEYPNGGAPLTGLLSLMGGPDWTSNPQFGWFDKRLTAQKTVTVGLDGTHGPFSATGSNTPYSDGFTLTAQTVIRVNVADTSNFRTTHVIWLRNVQLQSASGTTDIIGVITSIISTTSFEMRITEAQATGISNGTPSSTGVVPVQGNVGISTFVIGNANAEGVRSTRGVWTPPTSAQNYTQIFRTAFSFTRTSIKNPLTFDKTGIYKEKAKENSLNHMTEIERAMLFGDQSITTTTAEDGESVPIRTTGGVLWFLRQWELGTPYNVAPSYMNDYTDPNKRIITLPNNTINPKIYGQLLEKVFRVTNNKDYSKLCLCGNRFLSTINEMYRGSTTLISQQGEDTTYGMNVIKHDTLFGTVYYKTHPLFQTYGDFSDCAFFLDIQNLRYRPLLDSDTRLLANRQENDEDRRKDEWVTEAGLEVRLPESCMFVQGIDSFVV